MEFFNALITFIRDHLGLRGKAYLALMKDLKEFRKVSVEASK